MTNLPYLLLITLLYSPTDAGPQFILKLNPFIH